MDNKAKIFIGFTEEDIRTLSRIIEKYKTYTDKIFSSFFIKSFNNENVNKELMKQWAIFTDKINCWNKKYFYENFNLFFYTYDYNKGIKALEELYNVFNETFGALYENVFFSKNI